MLLGMFLHVLIAMVDVYVQRAARGGRAHRYHHVSSQQLPVCDCELTRGTFVGFDV
jgi:hypothetical protein